MFVISVYLRIEIYTRKQIRSIQTKYVLGQQFNVLRHDVIKTTLRIVVSISVFHIANTTLIYCFNYTGFVLSEVHE